MLNIYMYQGNFKPQNPQKYRGRVEQIYYRSSWELGAFLWCDRNKKVASWSSEEVQVPYLSPIDGKVHRYFVDLKITFTNGKTYLIEIKPKKQTEPPKLKGKKITESYKWAVNTYITNEAKWKYATEYAKDRNWEFFVWTEEVLEKLGIKVLKK